jgi:hypothetical protein
MKMVRRTSMVGRQEMRKGSKTTTARAGEKTKSLPDMIMKKMPEQIMKIKMPDMNMKTNKIMKIKMPDMRIQAGYGTLMFKHCLARRRLTPEVPLERNPS